MTSIFNVASVDVFRKSDAAIAEMQTKYLALKVTDPEDKDSVDRVHNARMVVKRHRVDVEKARKEHKAGHLDACRAIDGEAKRLTDQMVPIERHLQHEEDAPKREAARKAAEEQARLAALEAERKTRLRQVGYRPADPGAWDAAMQISDQHFGSLIVSERTDRAREKAEAEQASEVRRQEKERLKAEAVQLAEERRVQVAELKEQWDAQQVEQDRLYAERMKIDAEKAELLAAEQARERAKVEQAKALERAEQEKREATERAEQARIEEEAAAKRAEAMRPTKSKLVRIAGDLRDMSDTVDRDDAFDAVLKAKAIGILDRAAEDMEDLAR